MKLSQHCECLRPPKFAVDLVTKPLIVAVFNSYAGDSLSYHIGATFSTPDLDNDAAPGHCAVVYRGGWWYKNCHFANLNGYYYGGPHASFADGVEWFYWTGFNYSLRFTEMKFRPQRST